MKQVGLIFALAAVCCTLAASEGEKKGAVAGTTMYVFGDVESIKSALEKACKVSVVSGVPPMSVKERLTLAQYLEDKVRSEARLDIFLNEFFESNGRSMDAAFSMSEEERHSLAEFLAGKKIPEDQLAGIANEFVEKNNKMMPFLQENCNKFPEHYANVLAAISLNMRSNIMYASKDLYWSKGSDGASSVVSSSSSGAGAGEGAE